jgi:hypothetical protein
MPVEKSVMSVEVEPRTAQVWPWPDSLDAISAAPAFHRLLLENDHVRVLEVCIKPGQVVPLHTHRWPSVGHIKSASDFLRRDAQGKLIFDSRTAGASQQAPDVGVDAAPSASFSGKHRRLGNTRPYGRAEARGCLMVGGKQTYRSGARRTMEAAESDR